MGAACKLFGHRGTKYREVREECVPGKNLALLRSLTTDSGSSRPHLLQGSKSMAPASQYTACPLSAQSPGCPDHPGGSTFCSLPPTKDGTRQEHGWSQSPTYESSDRREVKEEGWQVSSVQCVCGMQSCALTLLVCGNRHVFRVSLSSFKESESNSCLTELR